MTYPQGELRNRLDRRSSMPKSGPSLPPLCVVRTLPTTPLTRPYHCSMMKGGGLRNISPGSFCSPIYSWTHTSSVQTNKQTNLEQSHQTEGYLLPPGCRKKIWAGISSCRLGTTLWITISPSITGNLQEFFYHISHLSSIRPAKALPRATLTRQDIWSVHCRSS